MRREQKGGKERREGRGRERSDVTDEKEIKGGGGWNKRAKGRRGKEKKMAGNGKKEIAEVEGRDKDGEMRTEARDMVGGRGKGDGGRRD